MAWACRVDDQAGRKVPAEDAQQSEHMSGHPVQYQFPLGGGEPDDCAQPRQVAVLHCGQVDLDFVAVWAASTTATSSSSGEGKFSSRCAAGYSRPARG